MHLLENLQPNDAGSMGISRRGNLMVGFPSCSFDLAVVYLDSIGIVMRLNIYRG